MKKNVLIIFILSIFVFSTCATTYYEPHEVRGRGVIVVTSEYTYTEWRTVTRERYIPGSTFHGSDGSMYGSTSRIETYTESVPVTVKDDRNLRFITYNPDGSEGFRGVTPIRVSNFNPGETYTIVWFDANGVRKQGTFIITTASPFTRNININ